MSTSGRAAAQRRESRVRAGRSPPLVQAVPASGALPGRSPSRPADHGRARRPTRLPTAGRTHRLGSVRGVRGVHRDLLSRRADSAARATTSPHGRRLDVVRDGRCPDRRRRRARSGGRRGVAGAGRDRDRRRGSGGARPGARHPSRRIVVRGVRRRGGRLSAPGGSGRRRSSGGGFGVGAVRRARHPRPMARRGAPRP